MYIYSDNRSVVIVYMVLSMLSIQDKCIVYDTPVLQSNLHVTLSSGW